MSKTFARQLATLAMLICSIKSSIASATDVIGSVVDFDSGNSLPCRLYVQNVDSGEWHFAKAIDAAGSAVEYRKQVGKTASIEMHTTLTAGKFTLQLAPGTYQIHVEYGKEFLPVDTKIEVGTEPAEFQLRLQRFINMPKRGWYSGDTHAHRSLEELSNVVIAEDLNVAFPMTYWVRDSKEIPASSASALEAKPINIDATHVIYPINTEYEIFTVDGKRHTQGAVFVLNHKTPLNLPTPPALPVAEEARRQGAILDLDKHSWAWSMMIVPIMNVDLFELSNNHNWRTKFGFPQWTIENAPDWPEVERDDAGFTDLGWTEFSMQTYYALLNCGYRMRVTAGTAAGVHPVPLGHGRVYVHTGIEFSYDKWIANLNAGHSFVTTGPLVDVRFNGDLPGTTWSKDHAENNVGLTGSITSINRLRSIELIRNGVIVQSLTIEPQRSKTGVWTYSIDTSETLHGSGWFALRCFEDLPDGKVSFAHTNPVFVDVAKTPLIPRRRDAEFFVKRLDEEISRNTGILPDESLAEYRKAKAIYEAVLEQAK
ncbi:MAG: CehA/McbA family metallohydrolase [Planctomycetota bacterium]|nr:CehA/McbA family metallohydrolase [Planctomycetota bacterium]